MEDFLLPLLASQTKSCLFHTQKAVKLSKSCQALKLQKKSYYNICQSQAAGAATSINSYKVKNNIREHYLTDCSRLVIQQLWDDNSLSFLLQWQRSWRNSVNSYVNQSNKPS